MKIASLSSRSRVLDRTVAGNSIVSDMLNLKQNKSPRTKEGCSKQNLPRSFSERNFRNLVPKPGCFTSEKVWGKFESAFYFDSTDKRRGVMQDDSDVGHVTEKVSDGSTRETISGSYPCHPPTCSSSQPSQTCTTHQGIIYQPSFPFTNGAM